MSKNKIGRNDPCRCGSGKKYKKCCMPNDKEVTKVIREETDKHWVGKSTKKEINSWIISWIGTYVVKVLKLHN